ncbi:hypothetical protein FPRO04_14207 [Fusarium proliferatum]|nr:hypothetical protein FPRO04_14207 [Fusarium proliferatum]
MSKYSIYTEADRILKHVLLRDSKLQLPASFHAAAEKVNFVGEDDQPFVLTPLKITESSAALNALVATAASAVATERYGVPYQDIEVNTDAATLFLESPIRRLTSNIYRTKDGRWYHLHGSMNATPTMEMLGVQDVDVSIEEAIQIYAEKVAQWDSEEIEKVANDRFKQAGVICYEPEEFLSSEHGKVISNEPLWTTTRLSAPRKPWPEAKDPKACIPLAGIRVIDLSRAIPAPAVRADILVDGYRPGALARISFSSQSLCKLNPSLIYMRENCYGFKGPLAYRSGWQQISDCLVGISHLQGRFLGLKEAVVPLLLGAVAAIQALLQRTKENITFDIDISLTQYNIWYYRLGLYSEEQQKALRSRDLQFKPRHYDEIIELIRITHESLERVRPRIFQRPEYYWSMSAKEYGIDDEFKILAPAFKLSRSTIEYKVPTGRRGRSKAEWVN